jgi:hypothetical protein
MKRRHSLTILLILIIASFSLTAPDANAQRGGLGRMGGRGSFSGGSVPAGSIRSDRVFVAPSFRSAVDGNFFNFPRGHFNPFIGRFGTRVPRPFVHGFPIGFGFIDGRIGVPQFNSGLGLPIPPLVTGVPIVSPSFLGVRLVDRSRFPFPTVIDLTTIKSIKPVCLDNARSSPVTIVNLPIDAFDCKRNRCP